MEITGKLITLLPLQTGTSSNGEWRKQDIIIETDDQYPKKICVSIWGDKINEDQLIVGNQLTISINIESREYNNRWYTDVEAWKIVSLDNAPTLVVTNKEESKPEDDDFLDDGDLPFKTIKYEWLNRFNPNSAIEKKVLL